MAFNVIVQARHQYHRDGSGPSVYTHGKPWGFCCDDMEGAWGDNAVGFGEIDDSYGPQVGVNIYHCLPYPEGAVWDEYHINFCPFCGTSIEIKVLDEPIIKCPKKSHRKPCACGKGN